MNPNTAQKELSAEELTKQLDRLLQDKADNQTICDWIEVSLCILAIGFKAHLKATVPYGMSPPNYIFTF